MDNGFFEKSGNGFWKKFIASGFTAIFTAGLFGSCTGRVVAMKEDEDLNSVLEKNDNCIVLKDSSSSNNELEETSKSKEVLLTPMDKVLGLFSNLSKEQREGLKPSTKETLLVALISLLLVAAIVVPIVLCSKSEERPVAEKVAEPVAKSGSIDSLNSKIG